MVGALVYPEPGLVIVNPVIVPVAGLKFAIAAAPVPPPPEITTTGAPMRPVVPPLNVIPVKPLPVAARSGVATVTLNPPLLTVLLPDSTKAVTPLWRRPVAFAAVATSVPPLKFRTPLERAFPVFWTYDVFSVPPLARLRVLTFVAKL